MPALQQMLRRRALRRARAVKSAGAIPRALDARRARRARRRARSRAQMKDPSPRMRIQAIRASETLYKAGDRTFDADYRALATDKDTDVAIQAMLTLNYLKAPNVADDRARGAGGEHRPRRAGDRQSDSQAAGERVRPRRPGRASALLARESSSSWSGARRIYKEVCFACHGDDGRGTAAARRGAGHDDGAVARELERACRAIATTSPRRCCTAWTGRSKADVCRRRDGADGDATATSGLPRSRPTSATRSATSARSCRRPTWRGSGPRPRTARRSGKSTSSLASLPVPLEVLPTWKASGEPQPGDRRSAR